MKMDDIDLWEEVPDTPDRAAAMHSTATKVSGPRNELCRRNSRQKTSILPIAGSSTSTRLQHDTDYLFKQASLALKISEVSDKELSCPQLQTNHLKIKQDLAPEEKRTSGNIVDLSKKVPVVQSHNNRCKSLMKRNGKEPHVENNTISIERTTGSNFSLTNSRSPNQADVEIVDLSSPPLSLQTAPSLNSRMKKCEGLQNHGVSRLEIKPIYRGEGLQNHGESRLEIKPKYRGKEIDLSGESEDKAEAGHLKHEGFQRNVGKRKLVSSGGVSPCNMPSRGIPDVLNQQELMDSTGTSPSYLNAKNQDSQGQVVLCKNSRHIPVRDCSSKALDNASPRKTRHRRLVRNGCISPGNITKNMHSSMLNISERKNALEESAVGTSSHLISTISPNAQDFTADIKKGKFPMVDTRSPCSVDCIAESSSSRACLRPGDSFSVNLDIKRNGFDSLANDGWRTMCNHRGANSTQREAYINSGQEDGRNDNMQLEGKNNCIMIPSNIKPSLNIKDSRVSQLQSSGQLSVSRSARNRNTQQHRTILEGQVIEVDELPSPEVPDSCLELGSTRFSQNPSAQATQIESDEILARQLQEQFYQEISGTWSTEEIDANITWSLQVEEDTQWASGLSAFGPSHSVNDRGAGTSARQRQSHAMRAASAIAHAHHPRSLFRSSSARSRVQGRNRFPRVSQVRRRFANHDNLEMRLNYLEALETAFDMDDLLRDFNEEDYEMLLALDENNHQHGGASDRQINSLPQSVVQSDSNLEDCAVCLEAPTVGDVIRHLPCLHKFHKECIDTWLRRKKSCPICKSDIT